MITPLEFRNRLLSAGLCDEQTLTGCSASDFEAIEARLGVKLPQLYQEVMRVIGRGAGDFMSDIEMFYPDILELADRLKKNVFYDVNIPDDFLIFASRYGEQVFFISTKNEDDSPVYKWCDEEPDLFKKITGSIWDFFTLELEGHEQQSK